MDAGIAAICGALAGSVGTIGAGLAAGWAQRESARIAARADHRRERSQQRYDSYKDLLIASSLLVENTARSVMDDDRFPLDISNVTELANDVRICAHEVGMTGPKPVSQAADCLLSASRVIVMEAHTAVDPTSPDAFPGGVADFHAAVRLFTAALDEFKDVSRAAFDDDGSKEIFKS
ncbi:hypothetical protein [Streptomyces platensis]